MTTILSPFSGFGGYALTTVLGIIFLFHGYPKAKNPSMMAAFWWNSKTIAFLHGAGEILAGLAVGLHIGARYGATFMIIIMLGAIYQKAFKWKTGFVSRTSTGWEFDLLILAGALTVLVG
jgi:uncharacterized membrane protein YphA (DoxX/SURF4 family)